VQTLEKPDEQVHKQKKNKILLPPLRQKKRTSAGGRGQVVRIIRAGGERQEREYGG